MFPATADRYSGNILVNLVIMLLIITGGIGFSSSWMIFSTNKLNLNATAHAGIILAMTSSSQCSILFLRQAFSYHSDSSIQYHAKNV